VDNLAIVGMGGHADVVFDCAVAMGRWSEVRFFDERLPGERNLSALEMSDPAAWEVFVAIGDNAARLRIGEKLAEPGFSIATIVHPSAVISPSASLGRGTVIMPAVVVNAHATIGPFAIVNTGSTVDHHCRIGTGTHIAPGAHLAGTVTVGDRCLVGIGAVVRQNITIGSDVTVGANAAVVRDVADGKTVTGVPAL
jgi:sugar O-acyltransferase (sialic acid O-acetyltransferase NeuD family)